METNEEKFYLKPHVRGLNSLDLDGIVSYIKEGQAKNIIIMQGAGISCAAGIPDFRTPGTGLYSNLQKYNLPYPEKIFELGFVSKNPEPFFEVAKGQLPGLYQPTLAHYLPVILHNHGLLTRVYTQNVDGLERSAGLPEEKVVEAHGSYYSGRCLSCKKKFTLDDFKEKVLNGEVPHCPKCNGIIKPDVVLFGENLPLRYYKCSKEDFKKCDLLIVIGSSLKVLPFCGLIKEVIKTVPRILFNNEIAGSYDEVLRRTINEAGLPLVYERVDRKNKKMFKFDHRMNQRDVFVKGDCQETIKEFVTKLGWGEELNKKCSSQETNSTPE